MMKRILALPLLLVLAFHCVDALRSSWVPRLKPDVVVSSSVEPIHRIFSPVEMDAVTVAATKSVLDEARAIASSFSPRKFEPISWLSNCHIQTIGGVYMRPFLNGGAYLPLNSAGAASFATALCCKTMAAPSGGSFWDNRERIDTPDGDWFHVDTKYSVSSDDITSKSLGTVLLLHGLESNSLSPLAKDMTKAYLKMGWDVHCLSFRGCSGTPNDTLGGYHLGFTDDLRHYLNLLKERNDKSCRRLFLSGFSLGGNVVLKALGELGSQAQDTYSIEGAAVLCVPLDVERNAPRLAKPGFSRDVYTANLLKSLKSRSREQLNQFCNGDSTTTRFDFPGCIAATTMTEFDQAFIAPIYGYADAIDYYRKNCSIRFLKDITVPTLIINALDDPFMDPTVMPLELSVDNPTKTSNVPPIKMSFQDHGGHCGFCFHQISSADKEDLESSWASTEMARFAQHIQDFRTKSTILAGHDIESA